MTKKELSTNLWFLSQRFDWWGKCPMHFRERFVELYNALESKRRLTVNLSQVSYEVMFARFCTEIEYNQIAFGSLNKLLQEIFVESEPIGEMWLGDRVAAYGWSTLADIGYKFVNASVFKCAHENVAVFRLNGKLWLFSGDGLSFYDSLGALRDELMAR